MRNHWLEERKKYVKIYDNTQNTGKSTTLSSGTFAGLPFGKEGKLDRTAEEYAGRVPKTNMWTLRAEIDDQFWYDRLNRELEKRHRPVEERDPEYRYYPPTQPGQ